MKWFLLGFGATFFLGVATLYGYAVGLKHARILQMNQLNTPKQQMDFHNFNDVD